MEAKFRMSALLACSLGASTVLSAPYKIPPSNSTMMHVPYISDEAMEQCVKLYNQAKWLADEIDTTQVDSYSRSSVNNYNGKINRHSQMTGTFNKDCAGKQSESAYKAAQKLNSLK